MPSRIKEYNSKQFEIKTAIVNKKSKRPSVKRKQWTEESMLSAMKAVEDGEKVSTAARYLLEMLDLKSCLVTDQ